MSKPSLHILLLLLGMLTTVGCLKKERINPYDPDQTLTQKYTHMMGGARLWTVWAYEDDTAYALSDIAFKVDIINDTTIQVFDDVLHYIVDDTANSLYYVKSTAYDFCSIRYFYRRDSIEFYKSHVTPTENITYTYNTHSNGL